MHCVLILGTVHIDFPFGSNLIVLCHDYSIIVLYTIMITVNLWSFDIRKGLKIVVKFLLSESKFSRFVVQISFYKSTFSAVIYSTFVFSQRGTCYARIKGVGVLAEILSAEHIPLYEEKFTQIGVPRWAQIALFGVLSRRGQNKIKVVYDPKRSGIFYVFA